MGIWNKYNILTFHRTTLGMLRCGESNTIYSTIQSVVSFLNFLSKPKSIQVTNIFIRFCREHIKYSSITKIPLIFKIKTFFSKVYSKKQDLMYSSESFAPPNWI